MLKKLSLILVLFMVALSLQSNSKASQAEAVIPVNRPSEIDRTGVIEFAKKYLGTVYRYASADPVNGFDCSGFVHFVFKNYNVDLPRGSREYQFLGRALKPVEFRVGDVLVFYGYRDSNHIGHVGIICEANGMKSKFIHASSGRAHAVTISELDSEMYTRRFYKCIDVID